MAKSFKDKTTAPGVYASIIGSAQQEQQAQPSIAQQPNNGRGQGGGMTQAAVQSLINGQGPAI